MRECKQTALRLLTLLLCALLLTAGGCRDGSGDGNAAQVRFINAVPAAQNLTVAVDGRRVWRRSLFRSNTGYAGVSEGTYPVQIAVGSAPAANRTVLTCRTGEAYTMLALSEEGRTSPDVRVFTDNLANAVPGGKARLHIINAGGGVDAADVLFNNIVGAAGVAYGTRSPALLLDAGTYDLKVNAAGDVSPLIGPVSLRLRSGRAYTLVVMGRQGTSDPQQALSLEVYPDDAPEL